MAKRRHNEFPLFNVESPPICKNDEKGVGDNPNLFCKNLKKKVKANDCSNTYHNVVNGIFEPVKIKPIAIWIVQYFHERKYNYVSPSTLNDSFIILNMSKCVLIICQDSFLPKFLDIMQKNLTNGKHNKIILHAVMILSVEHMV